MAKLKRVEQKNDDGHWMVVDSPSGKHAMVNIENVFKGGVRETLLEWAEHELSRVISIDYGDKKEKDQN